MMSKHSAAWLLSLLLAPAAVHADEISDSITDGAKQYSDGNYSEAIGQREYAATLIRQMKAEAAKTLLPQPLDGWTVQDENNATSGTSALGMVSVSRTFRSGEKDIKVSLVTDSPMLQSMLGVLSSPMMLSMSGGKMFKVGEQKVVLQGQDSDSHRTATTMVNNKVLVTVEGRATEADIKAYLQALDFAKIAKTL